MEASGLIENTFGHKTKLVCVAPILHFIPFVFNALKKLVFTISLSRQNIDISVNGVIFIHSVKAGIILLRICGFVSPHFFSLCEDISRLLRALLLRSRAYY